MAAVVKDRTGDCLDLMMEMDLIQAERLENLVSVGGNGDRKD
jgi:hypothetical protein